MIHVLCLNPAIDVFYEIDGFAAGEDYPGQQPRRVNGGKGINVARVLGQLGERPALYAFMGDGTKDMQDAMASLCECVFLPISGQCRTTINILDRIGGKETVITESGPSVGEADVRKMLRMLGERVKAGDIVVCSGSLPRGVPADYYAQISRICMAVNARCVLDCNAKTLPVSLKDAHYALGKPNERELCALLGMPRTKEPERVADLAKRLLDRYDALLVSLGAAGGILVCEDGALAASAPKIDVVSTVGSGDACLAGAVFAMSRRMRMEDTLRIAMACGAENASHADTGVDCGRVFALAESIDVQPIKMQLLKP